MRSMTLIQRLFMVGFAHTVTMRALYANSICAATDVETFTNQAMMTFMDKITLSQTLNIWLKYLLKNIY